MGKGRNKGVRHSVHEICLHVFEEGAAAVRSFVAEHRLTHLQEYVKHLDRQRRSCRPMGWTRE